MAFTDLRRQQIETMLDDEPSHPPTVHLASTSREPLRRLPPAEGAPRAIPTTPASRREDLPEEDLEEEFSEPAWCPWLFATTTRLQKVVAEVVQQALAAEQHLAGFQRRRPRRTPDLARFAETIEALVCHVVYEFLRGAGPVRVRLNNNERHRASRYLSRLQSSDQLPKIIKLLSTPDLAFLTFTPGEQGTAFSRGRQSTVAAGTRLITRIGDIELTDIDRRAGDEVVLLKGARDDAGNAELVEYTDDALTNGYRAEVQKLNAFLKVADLDYTGNVPLVDTGDRHMKRRFTRAAFGNGGRLWGGYWQRLRKGDRIANVRIAGERVVSIDYSSLIVRIAYAYVGAEAPAGDLYEITFTDTAGAPRVLPREIVKKIVAARLNGAKEWPEELREHRRGLPWRSVVSALKAAHAPIASLLDLDLGQVFAFTESEVLVDVLLRLMEHEVVALPVHDCVLVAEHDVALAERVMLDTFTFHTKQPGRVTIERAPEE